jgi:hypothetical protein
VWFNQPAMPNLLIPAVLWPAVVAVVVAAWVIGFNAWPDPLPPWDTMRATLTTLMTITTTADGVTASVGDDAVTAATADAARAILLQLVRSGYAAGRFTTSH